MTREFSISSGRNVKQITPSDTISIDWPVRGIIISGAGNVAVVNEDNSVVVLSTDDLVNGVVHPIAPKRINATGTTVAKIYGVY